MNKINWKKLKQNKMMMMIIKWRQNKIKRKNNKSKFN